MQTLEPGARLQVAPHEQVPGRHHHEPKRDARQRAHRVQQSRAADWICCEQARDQLRRRQRLCHLQAHVRSASEQLVWLRPKCRLNFRLRLVGRQVSCKEAPQELQRASHLHTGFGITGERGRAVKPKAKKDALQR